jgi:hypothetical protein
LSSEYLDFKRTEVNLGCFRLIHNLPIGVNMARRAENESLYKTFGEFMDRCLLKNRSLLWPDKDYWTLENLYELKRRMIDAPVFDKALSFEDKLEQQLSGSSENEWALVCDIYFVYFMPSTHIGFDKKSGDIGWAAKEGGLAVPSTDSDIWEALKHGFTRTAIKYHQKYSQFWALILSAIAIKEHDDPPSVIKNHLIMRQVLDMVLETIPVKLDRAYDMRHAMLYMGFPDNYERIISTGDKQRLVKTYVDSAEGDVPTDLDDKILKIRNSLSSKYDKPDRSFDFYQDMKDEWRSKIPKTISLGSGKSTVTVPVKENESILESVFSRDTFGLFKQLHENPTRKFYSDNKEAFKEKIENPFQGMFRLLAKQMPKNIANDLEIKKNLFSRILKNDYGRGGAWDYYWGAFYPKGGKRIKGAQLFAFLDKNGLSFGATVGEFSD